MENGTITRSGETACRTQSKLEGARVWGKPENWAFTHSTQGSTVGKWRTILGVVGRPAVRIESEWKEHEIGVNQKIGRSRKIHSPSLIVGKWRTGQLAVLQHCRVGKTRARCDRGTFVAPEFSESAHLRSFKSHPKTKNDFGKLRT